MLSLPSSGSVLFTLMIHFPLPRYGKYAVLDLLDVDVWEATVQLFDNVQAGLMESLLDKTILQKEK